MTYYESMVAAGWKNHHETPPPEPGEYLVQDTEGHIFKCVYIGSHTWNFNKYGYRGYEFHWWKEVEQA